MLIIISIKENTINDKKNFRNICKKLTSDLNEGSNDTIGVSESSCMRITVVSYGSSSFLVGLSGSINSTDIKSSEIFSFFLSFAEVFSLVEDKVILLELPFLKLVLYGRFHDHFPFSEGLFFFLFVVASLELKSSSLAVEEPVKNY